jgi:hypothetical protein
MGEKLKYYQELVYPILIYYLKYNPNYGKNYTIEDIERPSEELFSCFVSDCMTLGRNIPEYEEWVTRVMYSELQSLQDSSTYQYTIDKQAVHTFEDIGGIQHLPGFKRYVDGFITDYFGSKPC